MLHGDQAQENWLISAKPSRKGQVVLCKGVKGSLDYHSGHYVNGEPVPGNNSVNPAGEVFLRFCGK